MGGSQRPYLPHSVPGAGGLSASLRLTMPPPGVALEDPDIHLRFCYLTPIEAYPPGSSPSQHHVTWLMDRRRGQAATTA